MPTDRASAPVWNAETRYNPRVLMGNWQEDRMTDERKFYRPVATYKMRAASQSEGQPDMPMARHNAALNGRGLPTNIIFGHGHNRRKDEDLITSYDEDYNQRSRDSGNKLPELRKWSSTTMSWVPEKSDHPLQGSPTNYGLYESLKRQWSTSGPQYTRSFPKTLDTTYRTSFSRWAPEYYGSGHRFCAGGRFPLSEQVPAGSAEAEKSGSTAGCCCVEKSQSPASESPAGVQDSSDDPRQSGSCLDDGAVVQEQCQMPVVAV